MIFLRLDALFTRGLKTSKIKIVTASVLDQSLDKLRFITWKQQQLCTVHKNNKGLLMRCRAQSQVFQTILRIVKFKKNILQALRFKIEMKWPIRNYLTPKAKVLEL